MKKALAVFFGIPLLLLVIVLNNSFVKTSNSLVKITPTPQANATSPTYNPNTPNPTVESNSNSNNYYTNVDGNKVQSPTYSETQPSNATAKCRDGSYSFSQHRSGTCSGHGGVAQWL